MAKVDANSLRPGNIVEYNNGLCVIVRREHVKPGKGPAYIQAEMKNIKTGTKLNVRFGSGDNLELVRMDTKDYQYLYGDDNMLTLMDTESYEQLQVSRDLAGDAIVYLQDGMMVTLESYNGESLSLTLPEHVTLEVSETEAVVKGQTASSSYKPATLENGVRVMVPPFIGAGDKIVVKTSDSTYVERAK